MRDMSRAIRHELTEFGPTLETIPDEDLRNLTEILGAFFYDLVGEQDRRGGGTLRPAATVAREMKLLNRCLLMHHSDVGVPTRDCLICAKVREDMDVI